MAAPIKNLVFSCSILLVLFSSSQLLAQPSHKCGDIPVAPEIINGEEASLESLIEASKGVNGFIEEADKYLDCQAAFKKKAKGLPEAVQEQIKLEVSSLLKRRNEIGDEFNAQVAAYREANP